MVCVRESLLEHGAIDCFYDVFNVIMDRSTVALAYTASDKGSYTLSVPNIYMLTSAKKHS